MTNDSRPIIVITMGDASGVGPEIVVKALQSPQIHEICLPVVIGEGNTILHTINSLETSLYLNHVDDVSDIVGSPGTIDILDLYNLEQDNVITGKVCLACAQPNTQPIARTDDFERSPFLRWEGREPMFICAISDTGVAS